MAVPVDAPVVSPRRAAAALTVLAVSTFTFVTTEVLPMGLLTERSGPPQVLAPDLQLRGSCHRTPDRQHLRRAVPPRCQRFLTCPARAGPPRHRTRWTGRHAGGRDSPRQAPVGRGRLATRACHLRTAQPLRPGPVPACGHRPAHGDRRGLQRVRRRRAEQDPRRSTGQHRHRSGRQQFRLQRRHRRGRADRWTADRQHRCAQHRAGRGPADSLGCGSHAHRTLAGSPVREHR